MNSVLSEKKEYFIEKQPSLYKEGQMLYWFSKSMDNDKDFVKLVRVVDVFPYKISEYHYRYRCEDFPIKGNRGYRIIDENDLFYSLEQAKQRYLFLCSINFDNASHKLRPLVFQSSDS